jgi:hypothetical protein
MTHEIVKIPKRTGTATFPDVQQLLQQRRRAVVALALATIVALLGVLTRPSPPSLSTSVKETAGQVVDPGRSHVQRSARFPSLLAPAGFQNEHSAQIIIFRFMIAKAVNEPGCHAP